MKQQGQASRLPSGTIVTPVLKAAPNVSRKEASNSFGPEESRGGRPTTVDANTSMQDLQS